MMITGIDLYTWHENAHNVDNNTMGAYVIFDNGFTAGALQNSIERLSLWAGYSVQTNTLTIAKVPVSFGLIVGAISGYRVAPIVPLALPSVKIWNIRASYIPKTKDTGGQALHFSYEFKF